MLMSLGAILSVFGKASLASSDPARGVVVIGYVRSLAADRLRDELPLEGQRRRSEFMVIGDLTPPLSRAIWGDLPTRC